MAAGLHLFEKFSVDLFFKEIIESIKSDLDK
jgi:hypothetical protein